MLGSGGMADRRGLRLRLLFKTTPGGKGGDTGKRNWMLCSGWMDDTGAGTVSFKVRAWDPGVNSRRADPPGPGSDLCFRFSIPKTQKEPEGTR
jgi:hypothetical protein